MGRRESKIEQRGGARRGAGRPRDLHAAQVVLDKTLAMLEKRGYDGISVDEVAAAAGVAKTTIYRHWPSKPDLVVAAARPLFTDFDVPDSGELRADLVQLLDHSRQLMTGRSGRVLRILVREAVAHPVVADIMQTELHQRRRCLLQVLNRAVARGELRADVEQDVVADLLIGPLWVRTVVMPGPMSTELVEQVVDAVLRGVGR